MKYLLKHSIAGVLALVNQLASRAVTSSLAAEY